MEAKERLQAIMDASPVAISWADFEGNREYSNRKHFELFGYTMEEIPTIQEWRRLAYPDPAYRDSLPSLSNSLIEAQKQGKEMTPIEVTVTCKDGSIRNALQMGTLVSNRILVIYSDITEWKKAEESVRENREMLQAIMDASPVAISWGDLKGNLEYNNRKFKELFGYTIEDIPTIQEWRRLAYPDLAYRDSIPSLFNSLIEAKKQGKEMTPIEVTVTCKDGSIRHVVQMGALVSNRILAIYNDITELKHYQKFLENLSTTDGLTGIANRRRFDNFLEQEWRRAMRSRTPISLIFMDIDFFKGFNDHYGHLIGDDCLRQIAQCLTGIIRRSIDLAARYGGEEFACILPDTDFNGAMWVANRIQQKVNGMNIPYAFSSVANHVTISIGVTTLIPWPGQPLSDFIQNADKFLYMAKQNGRNQIIGKL
ncbi:MAG: diguanylate cyclase [Proteobacteria bacterium]|nr:diguanylate cyclase [Pseudomonadota bacterium]